MSRPQSASRRTFLKVAAATTITAPYFVRNLQSAPPSEKVRHASFGASGMAAADWGAISRVPNVQLVCIADVDMDKANAVKAKQPDLRVYQDWRELLDKEHKNLDSVNVSTPDHMHAPIGLSAMHYGLHVYGQKPLAHNVSECRQLTETAKAKKLVTQMGIQVHSSNEYRMAVHLVQAGAIGQIKEVHTWSNKKWGDSSPLPGKTETPPASLDWNGWLGVAAERPFIGGGYYHPGNWRKRLDFGTGTFGDMGCHIYDPVFAALALTAPVSVKSEGPVPTETNWANDAKVFYVFPGNKFTAGKTVNVTWYDGDQRPPAEIGAMLGGRELPGQGSVFIGTKGLMILPHVGAPILLQPDGKEELAFERPALEGVNHWQQFVDAVRGIGKNSASFDYSGPLTESVLLGGVASRFKGETLEWNAEKLTFTNKPDADQFLKREYRKGWEVIGQKA
ncbi:Gfo/Idh/MocA family protein [Anatilimnocola sp. NA78]|uniref:Gfo/Idh/MocA family protein n=1 Tax=Anatilimnocola sp. NA78 TaxID=3415683 RepID=UPI003CE4EBD7